MVLLTASQLPPLIEAEHASYRTDLQTLKNQFDMLPHRLNTVSYNTVAVSCNKKYILENGIQVKHRLDV